MAEGRAVALHRGGIGAELARGAAEQCRHRLFLKLAAQARSRITEVSVEETVAAIKRGALVIDIDEVTVPIPSRLRGQVRLTPSAICAHEVRLDPQGLHVWRPVAPFSRIDAAFEKPGLRWPGLWDLPGGGRRVTHVFWALETKRSQIHHD